MLDIRIIREREADVRAALEARGAVVDLDAILALDRERRAALTETEALRNRRNVVSKEISALRKDGRDASALQESMREVGDQVAALDQRIRDLEEDRKSVV